MTYQPKGSMCANCTNKYVDCSKLNFSDMPPMKVKEDTTIVKCTHFKTRPKYITTPHGVDFNAI